MTTIVKTVTYLFIFFFFIMSMTSGIEVIFKIFSEGLYALTFDNLKTLLYSVAGMVYFEYISKILQEKKG